MESIPKITEVFNNVLSAIGAYSQEDAEPYHKRVDRTNYMLHKDSVHSERHNLFMYTLNLHKRLVCCIQINIYKSR